MRLSQVARVLHLGLPTVVSKLSAKGYKVDSNPNTKIPFEQLEVLAKEFKSSDLLNGAPKPAPVAPAEAPRKQDDDVILYRRDDAGRRIEPNAGETPRPVVAPVAERSQTRPDQVETKPVAQIERKPELSEPTVSGSSLPGLKVLGQIDLTAKPKVSVPGTPAPVVPALVASVPVAQPVAPVPTVAKVLEATPTKPVEAPHPAQAALVQVVSAA